LRRERFPAQKKISPGRLLLAESASAKRMKSEFRTIPGSVVAPQGFLASGVFCDIKRLGTGKGSQKGRNETWRSSSPSARDRRRDVYDEPGVRRAGEGLRPARQGGQRAGHRRQLRQRQRLHREARE